MSLMTYEEFCVINGLDCENSMSELLYDMYVHVSREEEKKEDAGSTGSDS